MRIQGPTITLGQLLKLSGPIDSGVLSPGRRHERAGDVGRVLHRQAAGVVELPGATVDTDDVIAAIHATVPGAAVVASGDPLPFATAVAPTDGTPLATAVTPLVEGTRKTIALFTRLLADGLLAPPSS